MSAAKPNAPLTVVHVTAPAPVGGLESVVSALARGQAAGGHRPHVVSIFNTGEAAFALGEGIPGVTTHVVQVPPRRYWRERAEVAAIARECGAQVLHTHGYRPDVVDSGVAHALGVPAVTTVHGFTHGGLKNRLFEKLQERAFRRFDAVIAVSRPLVARLAGAGVPPARIHLIPNAWTAVHAPVDRAEASRRLGLPTSTPVLGWVGRLSWEKAPDVLLDAMGRMGPDGPTVAFVGDGPYVSSLRERAATLGLEDKVRWCGRVDGAAALYSAFDAFVLSSRTEGTPIALFEAMAAGVPVVATRVGGVPDVVSDGEALLVESENPGALAEAIRLTLADRQASSIRAAAAKSRLAREFAAEPWVGRYEELYRLVTRR